MPPVDATGGKILTKSYRLGPRLLTSETHSRRVCPRMVPAVENSCRTNSQLQGQISRLWFGRNPTIEPTTKRNQQFGTFENKNRNIFVIFKGLSPQASAATIQSKFLLWLIDVTLNRSKSTDRRCHIGHLSHSMWLIIPLDETKAFWAGGP